MEYSGKEQSEARRVISTSYKNILRSKNLGNMILV